MHPYSSLFTTPHLPNLKTTPQEGVEKERRGVEKEKGEKKGGRGVKKMDIGRSP